MFVTAYDDQESEAEGIANRIDFLVHNWREHLEDLSYRDIFVLSRTNHHLSAVEVAIRLSPRNSAVSRSIPGPRCCSPTLVWPPSWKRS